MITVEELVIQNLYHRLVLINVKKTGEGEGSSGDGPTPGGSESNTDGSFGSGDAGQQRPGAGLGFLFMGAMSPNLKRAFGMGAGFPQGQPGLAALTSEGPTSTRPQGRSLCEVDDEPPPDPEILPHRYQNVRSVINLEGVEITKEMQTVLDTGNIQLIRSMLKSEEKTVTIPPAWCLGPSLSHELSSPTTVEDRGIEGVSNQIQVAGVPINLDDCDQFSIVKIEDRRDPSKKSLVMVQANDGVSTKAVEGSTGASNSQERTRVANSHSSDAGGKKVMNGGPRVPLTDGERKGTSQETALKEGSGDFSSAFNKSGDKFGHSGDMIGPGGDCYYGYSDCAKTGDKGSSHEPSNQSHSTSPSHASIQSARHTVGSRGDSGSWKYVKESKQHNASGVDSKVIVADTKSIKSCENSDLSLSLPTGTSFNAKLSPLASPTLATDNMTVFVEHTHNAGRKNETGGSSNIPATSAVESPQDKDPAASWNDFDIDSGIWDMVHGLESKLSTRESTPNVHHGTSQSNERKGNQQETDDNQMVGVYRMFKVEDEMLCETVPLVATQPERRSLTSSVVEEPKGSEPAVKDLPVCVTARDKPVRETVTKSSSDIMTSTPVSKEVGIHPSAKPATFQSTKVMAAKAMTSTASEVMTSTATHVTSPNVEVKFVVDSEEMEDDSTVSSLSDIQYEFHGSLPMSPLTSPPYQSSPCRVRKSEQRSTPTSVTDSYDAQKETDSNTGGFRRLEHGTSQNQAHNAGVPKVLVSQPTQTDDIDKSSFPSGAVKSDIEENHIARESSPEQTHGGVGGKKMNEADFWREHDPTSPRAQAMNDSFVRGILEGAAASVSSFPMHHSAASIRQDCDHETDDHHTHIRDSGLSTALQPTSRIVTYRDPLASRESLSSLDMSDMCLSSDGEDIEVDVPIYDKHDSWMGDLQATLCDVPLTQIAIPGSHISMAIDRDMRTDMDFSKCNYEMADFLRKLPNLPIFNNFRFLMKKIWRAWMPKQVLSIPQQLQAGIRYFDMRITKLRGAFLAEHGLYTRQLKRYLKDMRTFLDEHPHEVIIIHFASLAQLDRGDKRRLVTMIFQMFGARLARAGVVSDLTLSFLWKKRKQIVLFFPEDDMELLSNHIFGGLVWSDELLLLPFPKKQHVSELHDCLEALYSEDRPKMGQEKFHVMKAVLSPDMTMVFGEFKYRSMRELAANETNPTICRWLAEKKMLNIVAVDFVGESDIVTQILRLNGVTRKESIA